MAITCPRAYTLRMRYLTVLCCIAGWATVADAQVFRCVDENGGVHYAQTPLRDGTCARLPPPLPVGDNPTLQEQDAFADTSRARAAERREQQAEAALRQKEAQSACAQARQRLAFLQERPPLRLARESDDGGYARFTIDEYEQRLAAARGVVAAQCAP
jgi:hypothetical protein